MMTVQVTPIEDARDLLATLERTATPGECVQMRRIIAGIERQDETLRTTWAMVDSLRVQVQEKDDELKQKCENEEYYEQIRVEYNKVTDREANLMRRIDQARSLLEHSDFNGALALLNYA